ncbi:MAG TPA: hypothetical protein VFS08_10490 [Gemmatimonadaceae bacterium]|nr:hypothetical protein [Gemmatimonadaceae bacterium]
MLVRTRPALYRRPHLLRFAVALMAAARLCVLFFGSAAEAREGRHVAAHTEPWGPGQHGSPHDETSCIACVAHHLVGIAAPRADVPRPPVVLVGTEPVRRVAPHPAARFSPPSLRGPPTRA